MKQDKIKSAILLEIMEHEIEINRLKDVLRLYEKVPVSVSDSSGSLSDNIREIKRKYVKSGKYSKKVRVTRKRKGKQKRKKLVGNLKRINWNKLIVDTLKSNGEPMTSKELVTELFSGKHKQTLKVLKRRISVILTLYKNDGTLKTDKNGRGCRYGLPNMF